jgi:hypothetical protein
MLGIEARETKVGTRGFRVTDPVAGTRIEAIGRAFVHGYDCGLVADGTDDLRDGLTLVQPELLGFAFEGAAMAVTLRAELPPGRGDLWPAFLEGCGDPHAYMLHVGAGWAFARLPRGRHRLERFLERSDPLLRWLAVDGYGFHHGFFGSARTLAGWRPNFVDPYGARAFDQGLGRSFWFLEGTDPARMAQRVAAFAPERHPDLWSGVGLAAAYAGVAADDDLRELRVLAGPALPHLQQGVAFAAAARSRAGNMAAHTEQASRILCGCSAAELAAVTDTIRAGLGRAPDSDDYDVWRRRVADAAEGARAC